MILRWKETTFQPNFSGSGTKCLEQAGLPRHAVQAITDPNRELVMQLLKLDRYDGYDYSRGGVGLHELCKQHSAPVIVGGGRLSSFVEESADQEKALAVIANAKCQRPSTLA